MDDVLLGQTAVVQNLLNLAKAVPGEVGRALYEEAQIEMTEAKKRTPVLTGTLKGSGIVNKPVVSGREISVQLQFGGPAAGYAIHVHENLEAFHKNGQAKFLESTLLESAQHMAGRVGRRVDLNRIV